MANVGSIRTPSLPRLAVFAAAVLAGASPTRAAPAFVVWAWERPEDLRFLRGRAEIAVQTGFVTLTGDAVEARRRRFPLLASQAAAMAVVHVQIDHHRPLVWSSEQRAKAAAAVLALARAPSVRAVQLDFEVRRSERQALLDLLGDVRAGLPAGEKLSMTAIASWCETEDWLSGAAADEIVPMLFRMGPGGAGLKAKLENGGDFAQPRCRSALAISADTPIERAPAGRTVYLFDPRPWSEPAFERVRQEVGRWSFVGR